MVRAGRQGGEGKEREGKGREGEKRQTAGRQTGGEMGQGQKGSSDKTEGKEKRHDFPPPEDGHKCRVCRFPLLVALLQLLLGVAVTAVAFLMLAISPSLSARETPHWAGIILCLVSILGFILYCVTYLPDERTSMQFIAKVRNCNCHLA
uniref:Sarcospan (Kras oncogene-associated gene) n=1 Tax=Amphiprion ocellaris TaxID=80972 RepID=A0A3Q1CR88_AMPOC